MYPAIIDSPCLLETEVSPSVISASSFSIRDNQDAVIMVLLITPPSPPFLSNHFLCFGRPWH